MIRNIIILKIIFLNTVIGLSQNYKLPWLVKPIISGFDTIDYRVGPGNKGHFIVKSKGRSGLMSDKGDVVLPVEYDLISMNWAGLISASKGEQTHFFTLNQKSFPKDIKSVVVLEDGRYLVENQDHKWGVLDKKLRTAVPLEYEVDQNVENVWIKRGEETIQLGRLITPDGSQAGFKEMDVSTDWQGVTLYKNTKTGKKGIMGKNGTPVTPDIYTFSDTKKGIAIAYIAQDKWGAIDDKGNIIVPFEFDLLGKINNQFTTIFKKGTQKGILNVSSGKVIVPAGVYDDILYANNVTDYYVIVKNNLRGICDSEGKVLLPPVYDLALKSGDYLYVVEQNKSPYPKRGLFSLSGEELLKPDSVKLLVFDNNTIYIEQLDGTGKHMTIKKEVIQTFPPHTAKPYFKNWIAVETDSGKKFYHSNSTAGDLIWLDDVSEEEDDGLHVVRKDGLFGLMYNTGAVLVPTVMDKIKYMYEYVYVKYKGKWGVLKNTYY